MKALQAKLGSIEGLGKRKTVAVVRELYPFIIDAQKSGYLLDAIHEEINKRVKIPITTFKTTFQRVKSAAMEAEAHENKGN